MRLSINLALDPVGTWLRSWTGPHLVPAGESYSGTSTMKVPVMKDGTYYFLFKTDSENALIESNEANNQIIVAVSFVVHMVVVPVSIRLSAPKLEPIAFQAPTTVTDALYPWGTFVWGVTNCGDVPTTLRDSWNDVLCVSTNEAFDASRSCAR